MYVKNLSNKLGSKLYKDMTNRLALIRTQDCQFFDPMILKLFILKNLEFSDFDGKKTKNVEI